MKELAMEFAPFIIFMVCFGGAMTFLHLNGLVDTACKAAVKFVRTREKDGERLSLLRCTGVITRVVKFDEDRTWEFTLDPELTNGNVSVTVLDRRKTELIRLDGDNSADTADFNKGERYYIKWNFKSASGDCSLKWEEK
ncbi:MAG: hypothetical protein NC078_01345 [Ruminococcus sp.]|nr:hypothetical protein [Ruminococcus sp.]